MARSHGQDRWSEWLIRRRSGGGKDGHRRAQLALQPTRDAILKNANLRESDTVLDVGSGDGFIGIEALRRLGPGGRVIFSDISAPCLEYIEAAIAGLGEHGRASFVQTSAQALEGVAGASVDVVTARSVLIYIKPKSEAFAAFYRVLREKGRLSISEPIRRDIIRLRSHYPNEFDGYDIGELSELTARILADEVAKIDDDPLTDFSHVDLLHACEAAGFSQSHMEVKIDITPRAPRAWDEYVNAALSPNTPTIGETFAQFLSSGESRALETHLRPLVESGAGINRRVVSYIWAIK